MRKLGLALYICFILGGTIGYVKDIIHLCQCDFKGPWKAEILYGIGAGTGLGCVIGWIDIKD